MPAHAHDRYDGIEDHDAQVECIVEEFDREIAMRRVELCHPAAGGELCHPVLRYEEELHP